jgi:hypothetical protein
LERTCLFFCPKSFSSFFSCNFVPKIFNHEILCLRLRCFCGSFGRRSSWGLLHAQSSRF